MQQNHKSALIILGTSILVSFLVSVSVFIYIKSRVSKTSSISIVDVRYKFDDIKDFLNTDNRNAYKSGRIYILEFMDYECPPCRFMHPKMEELKNKYKDSITIIKCHLPWDFHKKSRRAAIISEMYRPIGKFESIDNLLMTIPVDHIDNAKIISDKQGTILLTNPSLQQNADSNVSKNEHLSRLLNIQKTPCFVIFDKNGDGHMLFDNSKLDSELQNFLAKGSK